MSAANVNPVRLQQLLDQAMRLPPSERPAHVRRAAAHDDALRDAALSALPLFDAAPAPADAFWRPPTSTSSPRSEAPAEIQGLHAGQRIGDFTLLGFLGRGGMGQVWEAHQESLRRNVALKLVLPGRTDERMLELFVREAKAGGKCHHPNLVATLARGEDHGIAWLAQELVPQARTLEQALDHFRQLPELPADYYRQVAVLVEKVALGIQAAHDAGVIHRDLKPQNVLLGADGEPRVADFGLARVLDDSVRSQTGEFAGTYFYMSPEQVAAKRIGLDHRTDVWSLGVVLYEMLTLQRPFVGETGPQIAQQIAQWDPPRADLVRPRCPRDLGVVAEKAVQKLAVQRYPTMAAFAADLRRHLENRPILARPTGRIERTRKWVRRNPTVSATLVTAVAGALAASTLAWHNLALAQREATASEEVTLVASQRQQLLDEFHQLSGIVRLAQARERQQQLWPPWPANLEALRRWQTEDCASLLALRPRLQATIAELRSRALPRTPEERDADRRASPHWADYEHAKSLLASLRRTAELRRTRIPVVPPTLPVSLHDADPTVLLDFAQMRVAPLYVKAAQKDRIRFGEETLGLAAARLAAAKAGGGTQEIEALETLAWAELSNGDVDAARQAARRRDDMRAPLARVTTWSMVDLLESAIAAAEDDVHAAEARLRELEIAVSGHRTWTFGNDAGGDSARFLHDALSKLLRDVESLEQNEMPDAAQRLVFAEQVGTASRAHPKARLTWDAARRAIATADDVVASSLYRGLDLPLRDDQVVGLVPIGMNPVTKLWEFYDLRSAWDGSQAVADLEIPTHDSDGSTTVAPHTGIVFVLLPGGTARLGSQSADPGAPFFDPVHQEDEALHEVRLSPFLLARHEVTQAQWKRLCTWDRELREPSEYKAGQFTTSGIEKITATHPVEHVDWTSCRLLLTRYGMDLPTEAQWEYACRAGTSTPWNVDNDELLSSANLASQDGKRFVTWALEEWSDGRVVHAPVGTYDANAFGLYDVHGNVWEWCLDAYGRYGTERGGDGLCSGTPTPFRVNRGGSYANLAVAARSAARDYSPPDTKTTIGLRPARRLGDG